MKNKVIGIALILVVCMGLALSASYKNGATMNTGVTNPMSQYESIADLQRSVSFEFKVPAVVTNEKNLKLFNYLGNMVEIQSDNLVFRAAPFVANGADVSGDYNTYTIDNSYANEDKTVTARYRSDSNVTLVNITMNEMAYSVKFNTAIEEAEAFSQLDIDLTSLEIYDRETSSAVDNEKEHGGLVGSDPLDSQEASASIDNQEETSGENSGNASAEELKYIWYKNADMGITFMLPELGSEIIGVYADNQLAIMMGNSVVFVIQYFEDGYNTAEFTGYTLIELDDNYLLMYTVNNQFEKDTQLYEDYYSIVENMDTVANTFRIS